MIRGFVLVALALAPWCAWAAETPATLTILEGDALIYRGVGRVRAAEGVRLASGDIVETGANAFAQVEMPDRSVFQFGPATRAMLNTTTARGKPERWVYLMNGWCKVVWPKAGATPAAGFDLRARVFEIPATPGATVIRLTPTDLTLFDESGEMRLVEHPATGAATTIGLRPGDYYRRSAGGPAERNPPGASASLSGMPRAFRDSLPSRMERYRDQDVKPKDAPDFNYADVEAWLNAESSIRRPFVQRWRAKAREPAFRSALVANLAAHPEWDPVLFPEKYIKKEVRRDASHPPARPPSAPSASASAP